MPVLRAAMRLLLGWVFLRSGLDVLRHPEPRAATAAWFLESLRRVVPVLPADDKLLVRINAAVHLGGSALLITGVQHRLAALALATSLVPTTLAGHAFWRHDDPTRRSQQQIHFDKNLAMLGGLLVLALDSPRKG